MKPIWKGQVYITSNKMTYCIIKKITTVFFNIIVRFKTEISVSTLARQEVTCVLSHSVVSDFFVTLWTVAYQAPLSMKFSRQAYWSGLPFPFPGDLPGPGIEPKSPTLQVDSLLLSHWEAQNRK